jgi:hypothetical protein
VIGRLRTRMESFLSKPFLRRLGLYGGCLLSVGLIVWQQQPRSRLARTEEATIRQALKDQIQAYGETGAFTDVAVTDLPDRTIDRSSLVVWTTAAAAEQVQGPQQYLAGQIFPPSRDHSIIMTLDGIDKHFVGIAYGVDGAKAQVHLCQGDRPFLPTEIQLVEVPAEGGTTLEAQCPPDVTVETSIE